MNPVDLLEPKLLEIIVSAKSEVLGNNLPFGMIIDGTPGMSKTTSACIIARAFQPTFNIDKQVGRGIDQFIKAYNYTIDVVRSKVKVCIYDEANDADKSGSLGRIQRILNQVLVATSRQECVVLIVILHRFYRLDEKFFDNSLIDLLINLYDKRNDKYTRFRIYDIDGMLWMKSQISRGKVQKKPKVYSLTAPNCGGAIRAPPVEFMDEVERLSKIGKDSLRRKATRDILSAQYYTIPVLAGMLGVTKSMVTYQIDKLDLKDKYLREKSGRVFFYDKEVFAILKGVFKREDELNGQEKPS